MYVPSHFAVNDRGELLRFIREHPFAVLVSAADGIPAASHVPVVLLEGEAEDAMRLAFHLARGNAQSLTLEGAAVLAVFQGAHDHISASWYEHPERSVPTWNYSAVHCAGVCARADDAGTERILRAIVEQFEGDRWRMERAESEYIAAMKNGIVAFEIAVTSTTGVKKFSQNRTLAEREQVVRELTKRGSPLAAEMRAYYDFST